MSDIKHINCQKVLPLVYDESLSYYEVLCKLTDKQNEMIDFLNNKLSDYSYALIQQFLKDSFVNFVYDEENKRIKFNFNTVVVDGFHEYSDKSKTITIKEKWIWVN